MPSALAFTFARGKGADLASSTLTASYLHTRHVTFYIFCRIANMQAESNQCKDYETLDHRHKSENQRFATEVWLMQALLAAGRIGAEVSLTRETSSEAKGSKGRVESPPNADIPAGAGLRRPNSHHALQGESCAA